MIVNKNYELNIISKDQNKDKKLKKYRLDEIDMVGVQDNEQFEIELKNNTSSKIQVILSLDGINVLDGKLASTEINSEMWVVNAYSSLTVKCWPETKNGGASLIFTNLENSVVANLHDNLQGKGIIAAAIFKESQPVYTIMNNPNIYDNTVYGSKGVRPRTTGILRSNNVNINETNVNDSISCSAQDIQNLAIGAGEYTEQKITKVAGFHIPKLDQIVQIRYENWMKLRSKLREIKYNENQPTAFPGDQEKMIDLKSTPRISKKKKRLSPEKKYTEFERFVFES